MESKPYGHTALIPPAPTLPREAACDEAKKLVSGPRAKNYGPARKNFQDIADMWSVVFGTRVSAEQVALAMACLKIARLVKSPDHADSWFDMIGYGALGYEVASENLLDIKSSMPA